MNALVQSAIYPRELLALIKMKLATEKTTAKGPDLDISAGSLADKEFCYATLNRVSRSFAMVIRQLPPALRDAVCVFYLVLRGLDTIEDDMNLPLDRKRRMLTDFHKTIADQGWNIDGIGDKEDYRLLMRNFDKVIRTLLSLDSEYQMVISDITRCMGFGMDAFSDKPVKSLDDYNLYCHYVAGLVGYGLSGLFSNSGLEDPTLKQEKRLSNSMGLFLQKTNIIRDVHEDWMASRVFWPEEVFSQYGGLQDFVDRPAARESMECLNHMVTDALGHAADCLDYMDRIQHPEVFRFCAIPQAMAIATLAKVYNNPNVFGGVVKIRKGTAAKIMQETQDMDSLRRTFEYFARRLAAKVPANDPNRDTLRSRIESFYTAPKSAPVFPNWEMIL